MKSRKAFKFAAFAITLFGVAVTIFPLVWVVNTAFMGSDALYGDKLNFFSSPFTMENYTQLEQLIPYWQAFLNSAFVSLAQTLGVLRRQLVGRFRLQQTDLAGHRALFFVYVATMVIPGWPLLIPMYLTVNSFGWLDTYRGLIIPGLASPFAIFLLRQFINALPKELDEAAIVDGASRLRTLRSIVLPNVRAGVMAAGILTFLGSWNNLVWPMLTIKNPQMSTIPLVLTQLVINGGGWVKIYWGPLMMAALLGSIPTVLLFVVFQKQLIAGITLGGIKR